MPINILSFLHPQESQSQFVMKLLLFSERYHGHFSCMSTIFIYLINYLFTYLLIHEKCLFYLSGQ